MLKIQIGAIALEMFAKPQAEASIIKKVLDTLRDTLKKKTNAELLRTIESQKV
jgi:hypothetical protein